MKTYIKAISAYVPENRVSNDDLSKIVDTTDEWIFSHTGIKYRHVAEKDICTSELALKACRQMLDKSGIDPATIDLIITATATPDYFGFPSTACIIQDKIGAKNAAALDLAAACSGFIYGLEIANSFIKNGTMKNILVIAAELLTHITDWTDRSTCVLFGDGAAAAIVSENTGNGGSDILFSILRADGTGADSLFRKSGGSRYPLSGSKENDIDTNLKMDGQKVYNFAVKAICEIIRGILEKSGLTIADIAYIIPHQANARIITAASKRLKIPVEKFYTNIAEYANTSAVSIPIAIDEMIRNNQLKRGDLVITVGFGGGLTYGGNLIRW